jgi:hypothetical protein
MAPQTTLDRCLMDTDPIIAADIRRVMEQYNARGLCIYVCIDRTSPYYLCRFAQPYGPEVVEMEEAPWDTNCRVKPPFGAAQQFILAAWCKLPRPIESF